MLHRTGRLSLQKIIPVLISRTGMMKTKTRFLELDNGRYDAFILQRLEREAKLLEDM